MAEAFRTDVRVLGQLLVMQSVIGSLPDAAIVPFVIEGLADIPGVGQIEFHRDEESDGRFPVRFPVTTRSARYGEVSLQLTNAEAFNPYADYLRNFAFMLALILEGRQQQKEIARHRQTLEARVLDRTAALARSQERLELATEAGGIGVWDFDPVNNQLVWDRGMYRIYGVAPDAFSGAYEAWQKGVHPEDLARVSEEVENSIRNGTTFDTEFRIIRPDGEIRFVKANAKVVRNAEGTSLRLIGVNTDITESKSAADKIEHLAFHDPLTDLPNRRLLLDRLQQALTTSTRHHRDGALVLLDVDDFKILNDTLGHHVGDRFLVELARRLKTCVRGIDTVARHGGDEFVVIFEELYEDTLKL